MSIHSQNAQFLNIAEFAKKIGVPAPTLRRWDSNGWLVPHHKSPSGTRYYTEEQVNEYINRERPTVTLLTATEFANRIGVTLQTVRAYEKKGYLKPHYTELSGRRYYTEQQVSDYLNGKINL